MDKFFEKVAPIFLFLIAISFIEAGITADYSEARSRLGGRSFKRSFSRKPAVTKPSTNTKQNSNLNKRGFGRGLMGGLLGGAIGAFLFGSMFGAGGNGMGILPILLLAGGAYFLFRSYAKRPMSGAAPGYRPPPATDSYSSFGSAFPGGGAGDVDASPAPQSTGDLLAAGLAEIRRTDSDFDPAYFVEVASDVFFQVQAGWMRRDLDSYQHLLGQELAGEYALHFEEMRRAGHINKLESIAIRKVEVVEAGSDGQQDFVTVLFTANLLDYTVNDSNGELVDGSMTEPVKFAERWTWARPVDSEGWKLEAIEAAED